MTTVTHDSPDQSNLHMGLPMPNGKLAIWLFLVTEIMFFTGLIGAYIVLPEFATRQRQVALARPAPSASRRMGRGRQHLRTDLLVSDGRSRPLVARQGRCAQGNNVHRPVAHIGRLVPGHQRLGIHGEIPAWHPARPDRRSPRPIGAHLFGRRRLSLQGSGQGPACPFDGPSGSLALVARLRNLQRAQEIRGPASDRHQEGRRGAGAGRRTAPARTGTGAGCRIRARRCKSGRESTNCSKRPRKRERRSIWRHTSLTATCGLRRISR